MHTDLTWFKTKLLPTGSSIFTKTFYPEDNEDISIFCAVTELSPSHARVLIATRLEQNAIRVLTPHLALSCIDTADYVLASDAENSKLNEISTTILAKVGSVGNN
jgi:hypothetical protein